MSYQQVSNPPSAAYYITLIGGILGVIVGIFLLFILIGLWVIVANVLMIIFAQDSWLNLRSTPNTAPTS